MFFSVNLSLCVHIYLFFSQFSVHVLWVIFKKIFKPLHFILQGLFLTYKGRGERSVEETAGLVGFKLPKQYQDPWDYRWKHTLVVLLIMSYTGTTSARVQASVISCGLKESPENLLIIKNKCHSRTRRCFFQLAVISENYKKQWYFQKVAKMGQYKWLLFHEQINRLNLHVPKEIKGR